MSYRRILVGVMSDPAFLQHFGTTTLDMLDTLHDSHQGDVATGVANKGFKLISIRSLFCIIMVSSTEYSPHNRLHFVVIIGTGTIMAIIEHATTRTGDIDANRAG